MFKRFMVAACISLCSIPLAGASPDAARVQGDLRIGGTGSGLVFPDGTVQYTATAQGPPGPTGQVTLESLCSVIGATQKVLPLFCLTGLTVSPASPSITAGNVERFAAAGVFTDNSAQDLTAAAKWSSSNTSVASVDGSGVATALSAGSTTITAAYGSITSATTFTVQAAAQSQPAGPSGRLVQGPVLVATVFADNVSGGVRFALDAGEVSTMTDTSSGSYQLPAVPGYNYLLVSKGGVDKITGLPAIQMLAPAFSANVTPLTTLVALDTTGTVKAKLEALMPGLSFDVDISSGASQASLLVAKSVETIVHVMSAAVTSAPGIPAISAAQLTAIEFQTMQALAAQIAVTQTSYLATPTILTINLQNGAVDAAASIHAANPNVNIPSATASTIASTAVSACTSALAITGTTASGEIIPGGETAALASTAAGLAAATTAAINTASATITATATPTNYMPPVITVVTPTTVGTTGGTGGGTGQSF